MTSGSTSLTILIVVESALRSINHLNDPLAVLLLEVVDLGEPLGFGLGCNSSIPKERLSWFTVTLV